MKRLLRVTFPLLFGAAAAGCLGLSPHVADEPVSFGDTSNGVLFQGVSLPDHGDGYVRSRPGESTRFGIRELVATLTRAAGNVQTEFPGSAPLKIADLSGPDGGRLSRHRSHRTGRDADIIFYATDAGGRSVRGRGWLAFDRFGIARETHAPEGTAPSNDLFFFDEARNWQFVRTLVMDPEAPVQWIFCSRGVKARLLRYAAENEPEPEAIFRATWVLHQPTTGNPHADHFHVRIACNARQRALGCRDRGPIWPWIRHQVEKAETGPEDGLTDEALLSALLSEEPPPAPAVAQAEQPVTSPTAQ